MNGLDSETVRARNYGVSPITLGADAGRFDALFARWAALGRGGEVALCQLGLLERYMTPEGLPRSGPKIQPPLFGTEEDAEAFVAEAGDPDIVVVPCAKRPARQHFHVARPLGPPPVYGPFGRPSRIRKVADVVEVERDFMSAAEAADMLGVDVDRIAEMTKGNRPPLGMKWVQILDREPEPMLTRGSVANASKGEA